MSISYDDNHYTTGTSSYCEIDRSSLGARLGMALCQTGLGLVSRSVIILIYYLKAKFNWYRRIRQNSFFLSKTCLSVCL